ncbi:MAG TPA: DUF975 family protein [Anaerovoracaceae bacterium]|nr:DUF975 family protein [Anaerovoracaceae bacterium]
MNNYIINESSAEIRGMSRFILKDKWKNVAIGLLIYQIVTSLIPDILTILFPNDFYNSLYMEQAVQTSNVATLYNLLTLGAISLGFAIFMLNIVRFGEVHYDNIFEGFSHYFKSLVLTLLMGIFVILWTLLLIVPGIIALYRYSQAYYILAEDPKKDPLQCINESKAMMMGNKSKLFGLHITFIGWYILAVLPAMFLGVFLMELNDMTYYIIQDILIMIPFSFVMAYTNIAETIFYEMLKYEGRENLPHEGEKALRPSLME